jgi:hypothetical protein
MLGAIEHIPWALRFVSPRYVAASNGVRTLQKNRCLVASENGFKEIAAIFLGELRAQNAPAAVNQIQVQELRLKGVSGIAFGASGTRETVPVSVTISNGQKIDWELPEIKAKIETLKTHNLFTWGLTIFIAGAVLQIASFIIEAYGRAPA